MGTKASTSMDNSGREKLRVPGFNSVPLGFKVESEYGYQARQGPLEGPFIHGTSDWGGERLTVREIAMLRLMDALTDKPEWTRKIFDEEISARWKKEAMAAPDGMISEKAWDWVLAELRDRAVEFTSAKRVLSYDASSRVAKTDSLVPHELQQELKQGVSALLAVPDESKDWHPGSDDKVLNLVHPSLFPLVYGRSEVLQEGGTVDLNNILASCGKGQVAPTQPGPEPPAPNLFLGQFNRFKEQYLSRRFQWLPAEVEFTGEEGTTDVRITSYINNLHPYEHKELYGTVEKFISLAIPLWNDVLVGSFHGRSPPRIKTYGPELEPRWPDWAQNAKFGHTDDAGYPEFLEKVTQFLALPESEPTDREDMQYEGEEDDEDSQLGVILASAAYTGPPENHPRLRLLQKVLDDLAARTADEETKRNAFRSDHYRALYDKWERICQPRHPEPGVAMTYEEWKRGVQRAVVSTNSRYGSELRLFQFQELRLQDTYRSQGLQVIVKLASIELTPEKPEYEGGSWHLEGMINEHIVGTAIYYFDVDNVTDSTLTFRQKSNLDELSLVYEQDQHEGLSLIFGTESMRNEPAVQVLGGVKTPGGRMIAFPNTLQHRVSNFRLADPTRPGHRRFLVLWLVDPSYRICSTRNVPPQRHDWWAETAYDGLNLGLPAEVANMIRAEVGEYPIGLEEAKGLRLDLMAERTSMADVVQRDFEEYNLCEH